MSKKKDNGGQVETSLEHPNINLEEQEREKQRQNALQPHARPGDEDLDGKKPDVIQQQNPRGLERADSWSPERKAHAEKVMRAVADLYQFVIDNPSIEGILSGYVTGVMTGLSDPFFTFQELGLELPKDIKLPGAKRMEKEKNQDWWGGEIPEEKEEREKEKQHAY